jgi:hypothetical protein
LNEPDGAEVLDNRGVYTSIDRFPKEAEGLGKLAGLEEDVEREVDAACALVSNAAGFLDLIERELRAFVPSVEPVGAQIDGVGTIRDGSANSIEGAGRSEELWNTVTHHKRRKITDLHA